MCFPHFPRESSQWPITDVPTSLQFPFSKLPFIKINMSKLEDLDRLLRGPFNMNAVDENGNTNLHYAVRRGNLTLCTKLLSRGANPDIADTEGRTALHWASVSGRVDICTALLRNGANPDVADKTGETALHSSARTGNLSICAALLEAGAKLDIADQHQITPLYLAADNGHPTICLTLLDAGALLPDRSDTPRASALDKAVARYKKYCGPFNNLSSTENDDSTTTNLSEGRSGTYSTNLIMELHAHKLTMDQRAYPYFDICLIVLQALACRGLPFVPGYRSTDRLLNRVACSGSVRHDDNRKTSTRALLAATRIAMNSQQEKASAAQQQAVHQETASRRPQIKGESASHPLSCTPRRRPRSSDPAISIVSSNSPRRQPCRLAVRSAAGKAKKVRRRRL